MVRRVLAVTLLMGCQADLNKVSLEGVDSKAVCTDGSPAAYYYKPTTEAPIFTCDECASPDQCGCGFCGSFGGCSFTCGKDSSRPPAGQRCASDGSVSHVTEASRTWLIYLEGGGWCYDDTSCKSRCGDPSSPSEACSSKKYSDTLAVGGIFYPATNDVLMHAHKAFVKYCTSDAHMGDGEAFGFQFRGQLVVQAVLKDLVQSKGLGSGVGGRRDRIVFGGGSAGARGAMVHLDYVKEMLGSAAANVDVIGFLDSPVWIDKESYPQSGFPGFPYITQHVHSYANVKHLGRECAAEHTGDDQWKCMYGQYRLPTLQTPYFVVASQYDSYQLGSAVGHEPSADGELQYANEFAAATRQLVGELTSNKDGVGAFSWACYNHCVSTNDTGFNSHTCDPDGSTMDGAFKKYLAQVGPKLYQDDCGSFGCGRGCNVAMATLNEDMDVFEVPRKRIAEGDGLAVVV